MYEVQYDKKDGVNVFAGDFPIVTEVVAVATGKTVRKLAPVVTGDSGAEEAAAGSLDNLCGIAAADSTDGGVVVYMTGEFFASALTLPEGVTAADLKPGFRKLGIFLK